MEDRARANPHRGSYLLLQLVEGRVSCVAALASSPAQSAQAQITVSEHTMHEIWTNT